MADSVKALTQRGYTYEKDGALWLATSRILAENLKKAGKSDEDIEKLGLKDDVLRRANGFYTYFAADIAYHRNKFAVRGFDKVINVWGADHHGHVARLKGAMDALGLDGEHRLDIVLMQLVKLVRDGEVVRMSKRTGKAISLTDLLDEIPVDACRYFFNAKPETQMEFDLGLAVREDSENPVYYVQYAHARICTLLKNLEAEGYTVPAADAVDFSILTDETEQALIKQIASYGQVVLLAARDYDPSHINRYLTALAAAFHKFYAACRIKGEEKPVLLARLKLADTTRAVLKNAMTLIGCSAPGENVRGPCISNFCRYGRSLHRKGTPCGLAAGVFFRLRMDAAPVAASHPSEKISPNGRSILCLHGTGSTIHIDKTDSLWEGR